MTKFNCILICITAVACTCILCPPKFLHEPQIVEGPFRPFRPIPKPEPLVPLADSDGKLLDRLRGHIGQIAEERASRRVEAALQEVADKLESTNAEGEVIVSGGQEPSQFIGTSLFVGAIIKVIWKVVKIAMAALILSVLGSLVYAYWPWIVGLFTIAVTIVATPAGWAAGKLGGKK